MVIVQKEARASLCINFIVSSLFLLLFAISLLFREHDEVIFVKVRREGGGKGEEMNALEGLL